MAFFSPGKAELRTGDFGLAEVFREFSHGFTWFARWLARSLSGSSHSCGRGCSFQALIMNLKFCMHPARTPRLFSFLVTKPLREPTPSRFPIRGISENRVSCSKRSFGAQRVTPSPPLASPPPVLRGCHCAKYASVRLHAIPSPSPRRARCSSGKYCVMWVFQCFTKLFHRFPTA